MSNKLSILICTIPSRQASYGKLITELRSQILIYSPQVGIISNANPDYSIGEKRNWLIEKVESDYVCFIDDDDWISESYTHSLMKGVSTGCDCATLKGKYYINGKFDGIFEHSIKYKEWRTTANEIKYERSPNHLNMIKTSIAKQFRFPETNHGEDYDWSRQIYKSGLLKVEFYIPDVIYYYRKVTNK